MACSNSRISVAMADTGPAPSMVAATADTPFISPTFWLKCPMVTLRSMEIWPSSGDSSPMIKRNTVDLPAPLGPTRPIFSPRKMAALASMNRICGPCCLLMLSRRITRARVFTTSAPAVPARLRQNQPPIPMRS